MKCFIYRMHSTYFIYDYMVKGHAAREETRYRHYMGYSFRLAAKYLLYAPSYKHDSTYQGFCYSSREKLAGPIFGPHEGSIRQIIMT